MMTSWRNIRKKTATYTIIVASLLICSLQNAQGFGITNSGAFSTFTIAEEQPVGTVIVTVTTDQPADVFEMTGNAGDYLGINSTTGEIFIQKRIDKEALASTSLTATVKARKGGIEASASLRCIVQDINDVTPSFPERLYESSVSEKTAIDNLVYTVKAIDPESGSFGQQSVTYDITSGNEDGSFSITQYGGQVKVSRELDYETKTQYTLNITAKDNPGLSNWTILQITVLDADDLPAKFTAFVYTAEVSEGASVGTSIFKVVAFDLDRGINGNVTYDIDQATNPSRLFAINNLTGLISLNGTLDRESVAEYSIRVLAYSSYPVNDHAMVNIKVTDVNDNRPVFTQSVYQGTVMENLAAGTSVLKVGATDKDQGINAELRYHIENSIDSSRFSINNKTGVVTTAIQLDREEKNLYNLTVVVEDMGGNDTMGNVLNNTATVHIHVQDANDNAPVITSSSYDVTINESIPVGAKVVQVEAQDPDVDQDIVYAITGGNDLSRFLIGRSSGIIYVKSDIDRDPPRNETAFTLKVMALDDKNHLLNSTTTVTVAVDDVNDNQPHCSQDRYSATVYENATEGTAVTFLVCSDIDMGDSARLAYQLVSGADRKFNIRNTFGEVHVISALDYDNGSTSYQLSLLVTDHGNPPLSRAITLDIEVININDNHPVFKKTQYDFSVLEGDYSSLAVMIGKVEASDSDADAQGCPCGEIRYNILNSTGIFSIDHVTGVVSTSSVLDRETKSTYTLVVMATDQDPWKPLSNTTTVTIHVADQNDNFPIFDQVNYTAKVAEDAGPGYQVIKVSSRDRDTGRNANISYSIVTGNTGGAFVIDEISGQIGTAAQLDYETIKSYDLTVAAIDGGVSPRRSTVSVTVDVIDTDDNKPVCVNNGLTANIRENLPPGQFVTKISVVDKDHDINQRTLFRLVSDSFAVNNLTGDVSTTRSLDRENQSNYTLTVGVYNYNQSSMSVNCTVVVEVDDVNDNSPLFNASSLSISVSESADVGTTLLRVTATDKDEAYNSDIRYALMGDGTWFAVNDTTGIITLISSLDREVTPHYTLQIIARDRGLPQARSSMLYLSINVTDVNDNTPVFDKSIYSGSVPENAVNSTVMTVSARDKDEGLNSQIDYLITGGDVGNAFSISSNGTVTTAAPLDRETRDRYELTITARDRGRPSLESTAKAVITVEDVNDNAPNITNAPAQITVQENSPTGSLIYLLTADDKDLGLNTRVTYAGQAEPAGTFVINPATGMITTVGTLDRETAQRYTFIALATDRGTPPLNSSTVSFDIIISDLNDNNPVFNPVSYAVNISEDVAITTAIVRVNASDKDWGELGRIAYRIEAGDTQEYFAIDNTTGVIRSSKSLDRESIARFDLVISAKDHGSPARYAYGYVTIFITDTNDLPPVFTLSQYSTSVQENIVTGTPVTMVTATDGDIGPNAKITYSIVDGEGMADFNVTTIEDFDPGSQQRRFIGRIYSARDLDRESRASYNLTVLASDGVHNSTSHVVITLQDVNDNPPIFDVSSRVINISLDENTPGGTKVLNVTARDIDEGSNARITYSIEGAEGHFYIDSNTGVLYTTPQTLDREIKDVYNLTITASDPGNHQDSITVIVNILDINDNPPRFNSSVVSLTVDEGSSVIINVTATDPDQGANQETDYRIISGNDDGVFQINNITGRLMSVTNIDRERLGLKLDQNGYGVYSLVVEAADHGQPQLSSTTNVVITVKDVNDNAPVFQKSMYTFEIPENASVGGVLGTIKAEDIDIGANGQVSYSIMSTGNDIPFAVTTWTGILSVNQSLDREVASSYDFAIQASDAGSPSLNSTATVKVVIKDINDNKPKFGQESYHVTIPENTPGGTEVLKLDARDTDEGSKGQVEYAIVDGGIGHFIIEEASGIIRTVGNLDYEANQSYTLNVSASDGGSPSLRDSVLVFVNVSDINDNAPVFNQSQYSLNVSEGSPVAVLVQATDLDRGTNANVSYSLVNDFGSFAVNEESGELTNTRQLDREDRDSYQIQVKATDKGVPPLSSITLVTIFITDTNDLPPVFTLSQYSTSVQENIVTGTPVTMVTATDGDIGPNAKITYSIVDGEGMADFNVTTIEDFDPGSQQRRFIGRIYSARDLDRESRASYNLTVLASDGVHNSTSHVVITLQDVNDNPPIFDVSSRVINISLDENTPGGTKVLNVTARDIDEGSNARITYSIEGAEGHFYIDSNTGVLYTTPQTLDRETKDVYNLTITASDPGNHQDSITVIVNILDINDNPPRFNSSVVSLTVDEGSSVIINVTATDPDQGANQETDYRIISGNDDGVFQINNITGRLMSVTNIDRERLGLKLDQNGYGVYSLVVEAADHGQPQLSSTTNVMITVKDVNDNAPVFQKSMYTFEIPENASVGDVVGSIKAEDIDIGANGQVLYSIMSTGNDIPFAVTTWTGILSVNQSLDREVASSYDFAIQASDAGSPSLNSTATVKVVIKDINDNKPKFGQESYHVTIPENTPGGTEVLKLDARDTDEGSKGQVEYAIVDGGIGHFIIEEASGIIRTVGNLDYEANQSYTLNVSASDGGSPSLRDSVLVFVNVSDINDNAPVFNQSQYSLNVSEGSPVAVLVQATDLDRGTNANVSYSLVNDFGSFAVNEESGELTNTRQLDREDRDSYQIQVKATDKGVPPLSSITLVKISVTDVNDNEPTFSKPSFNFQTSEDALNGAVLGLVMAVDRDAGDNARLNYSITGGRKDFFKIDSRTGSLSLVRSAIGLANQNISLQVTCSDSGIPRLSSDVNVSVLISTGSKKVPKLVPRHLNVSVYENASTGDTIVKLNVSVAENIIDYLLLAGDQGKFALNSTNGMLSLIGGLDREKMTSYMLYVKVQDRTFPLYSNYGTVFIDVLDINDNQPTFIQEPFGLCLPEDTAIGLKVARVKATDPDDGVNGQVFYSLRGDASSTFSIDNETGDVFTKTALDYETTKSYNLTVIAENTLSLVRMRSLITFNINIEDTLDYKPTFQRDWLKTSISEDAAIGSFVIDVNATLSDKLSRYVFYRLLHNMSSVNSYHFMVEPESGIIQTQSPLDRETTSNYTLVVEARDLRGTNEYRAIAHVIVDILDVNDNDPVFVLQSYTFSPNETSSVGDVIGQIQARDADEDENAEVQYDISDGNQNGFFAINSSDGRIVVAKTLDFESQSTFTLKVRAYDKLKGRPARRKRDVSSPTSSQATITVQVQDVNDNPPIFTQQVYLGRFYPETSESEVAVTVKAIDNDSGTNSMVRYYARNESLPGVLSLNSITGHLMYNKSFLNERTLSYFMHVSARDNNGIVPYNTASNPATVMVFYLTPSTAVTLTIGVPLPFVTVNRKELESLLRNITGQTVFLKSLQESPDDPSQTIAVVHLVNNTSMTVIDRDQAIKIFFDKSGELETRYPKWKIKVLTVDSPKTTASRRRAYFSFYIAAMMMFAVLIGIVGLIGLIVVCRYKQREKKLSHDTAVKGTDTELYSINIPGIGAYIESRADYIGTAVNDNEVQGANSNHQNSTNEGTDSALARGPTNATVSHTPLDEESRNTSAVLASSCASHGSQSSSQGNTTNTLNVNQSNSTKIFVAPIKMDDKSDGQGSSRCNHSMDDLENEKFEEKDGVCGANGDGVEIKDEVPRNKDAQSKTPNPETTGAFTNSAYEENDDGVPRSINNQSKTPNAAPTEALSITPYEESEDGTTQSEYPSSIPKIEFVSRNPFARTNISLPNMKDGSENLVTAESYGVLNGRSPMRRSDSYSPADNHTKNNIVLLKNGQARGLNFPGRSSRSIAGVYDVQKRREHTKKKKRKWSRSPHVRFDLQDSQHPDELEWERQVSGNRNIQRDPLDFAEYDCWSDADEPVGFYTFGRKKNESKTDDSPDSCISGGDDCKVMSLDDALDGPAYPPSDDEKTKTYVINTEMKNLDEAPLDMQI